MAFFLPTLTLSGVSSKLKIPSASSYMKASRGGVLRSTDAVNNVVYDVGVGHSYIKKWQEYRFIPMSGMIDVPMIEPFA